MLPDRVSNPGPLTYESGALPIALRGTAAVLSAEKRVNNRTGIEICFREKLFCFMFANFV